MGSWDELCNFSRLGIKYGDRVVATLVTPTTIGDRTSEQYAPCYPSFRGTYNMYGGVDLQGEEEVRFEALMSLCQIFKTSHRLGLDMAYVTKEGAKPLYWSLVCEEVWDFCVHQQKSLTFLDNKTPENLLEDHLALLQGHTDLNLDGITPEEFPGLGRIQATTSSYMLMLRDYLQYPFHMKYLVDTQTHGKLLLDMVRVGESMVEAGYSWDLKPKGIQDRTPDLTLSYREFEFELNQCRMMDADEEY
jgi:hypothetical protein